jgi:hypothetical protein
VQRHHIGEIVSRDVDAPRIPIKQPQIVAAGLRQKYVPDMRITLNDRGRFE